jgi:hypothetical protein
MESIKMNEIDDYLDAVLSKYKGSGVGLNFMESPKNNR